GRIDAGAAGTAAALPPFRIISADGALVPPGPDARPLEATTSPAVTIENPPGFYGTDEGVVAHNLLPRDAEFLPITRPSTSLAVTEASYAFDQSVDLKGPLIAAAILLMLLDTLAVFWMGGLLSRRGAARRLAGVGAAIIALSLVLPPSQSPVQA